MTNFFKNIILPFFKRLSFKDWLLLLLMILCIFFYFRIKYLSEQNLQNQLAFQDKITIYENKLGEQYSQQQTYITSINELREVNSNLYNEVKHLKDHPLIVTKTKTEFQVDTIYMTSTGITEITDSLNNQQYKLNWVYNDHDYFNIDGYTLVNNKVTDYSTVLNNLKVNQELSLNVIDNGKNLSVIVKSDNPYIKVSGMQSVVIDPTTSPSIKKYFKQKRWSLGPSISIGVDQNLRKSINLGISLQYTILQF